MTKHQPSPVDLPGSTLIGGRPLWWTTVTIAAAALFLAAFNAVAINDWAVELTPSPTTARLVAISDAWVDATDRVGIGAVRAAVHGRWEDAKAARF